MDGASRRVPAGRGCRRQGASCARGPLAGVQANVNLCNVFNSAISVRNVNDGAQWRLPSLMQDGRMLQFSASLTY